MKFYGNVIETNGTISGNPVYKGVYVSNGDVIYLGYPYTWAGYNTIRDNLTHQLWADAGNPIVHIAGSSVHNHNSVGFEIYNRIGNPQINTLDTYWGDQAIFNSSGPIYFNVPHYTHPTWEGTLFSNGSLGKDIVPAPPDNNDWIVDPSLPDIEKIKLCKDIIVNNPFSEKVKAALIILYSIIRGDYVDNLYGERDSFLDYLSAIQAKGKETEIGKLALRYMIFWRMLERNDEAMIQLSQEALNLFTGEDRKLVLGDLALKYSDKGQTAKARSVINEIRNNYSTDMEMVSILDKDVSEMEWKISKGFFNPEPETSPLGTESVKPQTIDLSQNYPNPGNPSTRIRFTLPEKAAVTVKIVNILGEVVCTLADRPFEAGVHEVVWDGKNEQGVSVSSGVYLYVLQTPNKVFSKKLTLLK